MMDGTERPLRICMLSYRSNPHCGGQGVYLYHLSRALVEMGHQVDAVCGPPDPLLDPRVRIHRMPCLDLYEPANPFRVPTLRELAHPVNLIEWFGVSTMGFPEPFTFGLRAYHFLRRRLSAYDIIHDNQSLSYGVWALSRRIPLVATVHHPITVDRNIDVKNAEAVWQRLKFLRWYSFIGMQRQVVRKLAGIITVSQAASEDIVRAFGVAPKRIFKVANGVDIRQFKPQPDTQREAGRLIVTTSADTPLKGLTHLLRAFAHLRITRDLHLVVVGTPKKNGTVQRLLTELDLTRSVTIAGRLSQQQFTREYARAALAVVPSVYEGFGLPAAEAMACAVPVISTSGGALAEVVGDAGLLVPPADWRALAAAIAHLLDHPRKARALAAAGYRRVHDLFSWQQAAQRTVAAYRRTIDAYRRP